ncbi:MAG: hypothetical protein JXR58_07730, partial [Bacteroidales bacterium]|nr:hypothetical protein [Bacteroidales bacterium]
SPFYKKVPKNTYRYNEREPLLISHVKMALLKIPEKNLSGVQKFLLLILWAVFLASPTAILLLSNNSF